MFGNNHSKREGKPGAGRGKLSNPYYCIGLVLLLLSLALFISWRTAKPNLAASYRVMMDTAVELRYAPPGGVKSDQVEQELYAEIERLELIFSRAIAGSEINLINHSAGISAVKVSPDFYLVIEKALSYAALSGGAFDPTIAPLTDLWGFFGQEYNIPDRSELENALRLVDFRQVDIDAGQLKIYLPLPGMGLELGGIAKGYIVDRALELLRDAGVEHAFVNAGGDIALIGPKPDGTPWRIGVRHPRRQNEIIAVIPAVGGAVATSGDYQRRFEEGDLYFHHLLDPESGQPARELVSVTVVAPTALEADALSTAVFILGPEEGMALLESLEGVEGILITPDLAVLLSRGLEGIVEIKP